MKLYKRWSFWLTAFAIGVCTFNLLGYDDKNLLLFFASPPGWLIESNWFAIHFTHPANIPIGLIYILTILFWLLFGCILDWQMIKIRRHISS